MIKKLLIIYFALVIFLNPFKVLAQAPNLGTAANFVLFTSVGAVTNSGTGFLTKLTGNVGTNSAPTMTGFGNVNGQMHYTADAVSANCQADLSNAYNQLNSATPTFFPSSGNIGNGDTLTAGIYKITSSPITLSGNLILNGQGNSNAVFIFQFQSAFSSNANAKIKLINGALACNVFWKVEGAVSLASGTTMRGTIIANNAAISFSSGDTLEGRALSTTGAISLSQLTGYLPIGCGSATLKGPLAPNLLSIGCYASFTSVGANTDAGGSTTLGDVGTNSGSASGYDSTLVGGKIHQPDTNTAYAASNLASVYTYLHGLSPGNIELLFPALLGHNLELTPHIYLLNGAVTLTDSLIFNAQGNSDAVFVILINGAFSTTSNSKIILTNGAQAKNIYWKITGAVAISNNSIFNGNIISVGAIDLASGVTINGRALTTNGALNLASSNVYITSNPIRFPSLSRKICTGDSTRLILGFSGNGFTYQWRKGNVNLVDSGRISGVYADTLKIYPFIAADTSSFYNVIVTKACLQKDTSGYINIALVSPVNVALASSAQNSMKMTRKTSVGSLIFYGDTTYNYFAIDTSGITSGSLTGDTVMIAVNTTIDSSKSTNGANQEHAMYLLPRYWNATGNFIGTVKVIFPYSPADTIAIKSIRDSAWALLKATTNTNTLAIKTAGLEWFKTTGVLYNASVISGIIGNKFPIIMVKPSFVYGLTCGGVHYVELSGITSFSGGGAGLGYGVLGAGGGVGLPVTWAGFEVKASENGNELSWKTASEKNLSHFEVNYSADGRNFQTIGEKITSLSTNIALKTYLFTHLDYSNYAYYRIKQVDNDGLYDYSQIKMVKRAMGATFQVTVFPIPIGSDNELTIRLKSIDKSEINIRMTDMFGKTVFSEKVIPSYGYYQESINIEKLNAGLYIMEIQNGQGYEVFKIIKLMDNY